VEPVHPGPKDARSFSPDAESSGAVSPTGEADGTVEAVQAPGEDRDPHAPVASEGSSAERDSAGGHVPPEALGPTRCIRRPAASRDGATPPAARSTTSDVETRKCGGVMGGFQLLEVIGEGGMGEVYKAKQISLDRVVALKVLLESFARDRDFVARFEREARTAAKLSHPNIVGAVDVGKAGERHYFAMEFIDGRPVTALLKEKGKLPEEEALDIVIQSARGLDYAWRNGMVHRDIKPDNLLMTAEGVVKIADLGLAREAGCNSAGRLTQAGAVVGTPYYVSPEQIRDENVDIRADIYSLGVTFYQLVTGDLPFKGRDSLAVVSAHLHASPRPVDEVDPEVSPGVARVIGVMMARDRNRRYPDPKVLLHDLGLLAEGGSPEYASSDKRAMARAVKTARKARHGTSMFFKPRKRRRFRGALLGALGAVGIAALLASALIGRSAKRGQATTVRVPLLRAGLEATRKDEAEAADACESLKGLLKQGRYDEALLTAEVLEDRYAHTAYAPRIENMRLEAMRRADEAKRAAAERAAAEAKYAETLRLAREAIAMGDHAAAMSLLLQAKATRRTDEVDALMREARRLQHLALARDADAKGDLALAVELYGKALAAREDDSIKARLADARRRMDLARELALARRLAAEGLWDRAGAAYSGALELAGEAEATAIETETAKFERDRDYMLAMERASEAAKSGSLKDAISFAEKALKAKPEDAFGLDFIARTRDTLGPEPEIVDSLGMRFVLVKGGPFVMGGDDGPADERPARTVELDAYYIGRHEVTNAQFEQFSPGHRSKWREYSPGDDTPAVAVTWEETASFCRWLSRREGVEYRLPTEAEWEMAARGADARRYPWGDEGPTAEDGSYRANFAPARERGRWRLDGFELASPIGMFPSGASPCGCLDMAGNVWEWCLDRYAPDCYASAPARNPVGPEEGDLRAIRGGSYTTGADTLRCSNRLGKPPGFYEVNLGFRCVREVRQRARPAGDGGDR